MLDIPKPKRNPLFLIIAFTYIIAILFLLVSSLYGMLFLAYASVETQNLIAKLFWYLIDSAIVAVVCFVFAYIVYRPWMKSVLTLVFFVPIVIVLIMGVEIFTRGSERVRQDIVSTDASISFYGDVFQIVDSIQKKIPALQLMNCSQENTASQYSYGCANPQFLKVSTGPLSDTELSMVNASLEALIPLRTTHASVFERFHREAIKVTIFSEGAECKQNPENPEQKLGISENWSYECEVTDTVSCASGTHTYGCFLGL